MWTPSSPWTNGSLGPLESIPPNWHIDQFSRLCRVHDRDQQTDTRGQTDHATLSVAMGRILLLQHGGLKRAIFSEVMVSSFLQNTVKNVFQKVDRLVLLIVQPKCTLAASHALP